MSRILIAVPSKGRPDDIMKNTLSWLQHVTEFDYRIFVEPQDYNSYKQNISEEYLVNIQHNNKKLGFCKLKILEYSRKNNYDFVFKMDDDVKGFTFNETWGNEIFKKQSKEGKKIQISTLFKEILKDCVNIFDNNKEVGLINFAHSSDIFNKKELRRLGKLNSFMGSIYLFRRELIMSKRMLRDVSENLLDFPVCFNINEDNVTFLSTLEEGYYTLKRCDMIFNSEPVGVNKGGHNYSDRASLHALATSDLRQRYYPKLDVKIFRDWTVPDWSKSIKGTSIKEGETIKEAIERYNKKGSKTLLESFFKND